jgi:tRNA dimethylallyltransferase
VNAPPVIAIVGPTAAGKSALGVAIAHALGGEVVNADSMQLYRGMDIGTAKLGADERDGIPHHLLDIWDVTTTASVADYQASARAAVDDIRARGRAAVIVGGSGLYVRALLDDLSFPGTDPQVRARLEADLAEVGALALHARLLTADPVAAAAILPSNGRRVVRALEVIELTGRPFTASLPAGGSVYAATQLGLELESARLDRRIADRVNVMWERGLVGEVGALLPAGLREGVTASKALGYAQVIQLLDGYVDDATAREQTVIATRQFVRRQRKWFRRDPRIGWLDAERPDLFEAAIAIIEGGTGFPVPSRP